MLHLMTTRPIQLVTPSRLFWGCPARIWAMNSTSLSRFRDLMQSPHALCHHPFLLIPLFTITPSNPLLKTLLLREENRRLKETGQLTWFEVPGIRRWTTPHQDIVIITTLAYRM
jgi:hypothetical protein